ncbi:MAG TPA: MASE3 domain-containing protein [Desulfuromonadales bacterium]|nr:MASE3 domain-containing protein [Desulfuromonadales bacterium]
MGFYLLSRANYLLFHAIVELFSIVVACGVFMIVWNSRRFQDNGFFLCLGIGSLFVAGVDFLHTLAYKNMGVFPGKGANLATQLWIVARYLEAGSLLLAPTFLSRRLRPTPLFGGYLAVSLLLLAAVFGGIFPDCFREGTGLTPFKIGSEYLICFFLAGSLVVLRRYRQAFDPGVHKLLSLSVGAFILAELSFTLYTDVFGLSNMAGHLFKVAGFYLIYRGVIETGLTRPYDLLFRELKQSEASLSQRSAELEAANEELASAIEEQEVINEELMATNEKLAVVNEELAAANSDLEAFNYSVSHDLRGPLTAICGNAQVVLELFPDRADPQVLGLVRGILEQGWRMDDLIGTLLNLAQLNRVAVKRQPVDLSAMAKGIATALAAREPNRQAAFDIAAGMEVEADPALLQVALENLLGNAWKYTGKAAEAAIGFGTAEVEGARAFFVRDNGTGFDMTQAADLFTPFKRLHPGEDYEGFGVGLATVQRIVSRHGGRVWAESAPGRGATFYFTL